ncbi:hypothetical protein AMECASPLE_003988 [Ameca splendens]|uniref:Uncharacterized protein n=1 Tax=Ameca splendens TaxID=208324 RepID=A0ABV0XZ51_9TELE
MTFIVNERGQVMLLETDDCIVSAGLALHQRDEEDGLVCLCVHASPNEQLPPLGKTGSLAEIISHQRRPAWAALLFSLYIVFYRLPTHLSIYFLTSSFSVTFSHLFS